MNYIKLSDISRLTIGVKTLIFIFSRFRITRDIGRIERRQKHSCVMNDTSKKFIYNK